MHLDEISKGIQAAIAQALDPTMTPDDARDWSSSQRLRGIPSGLGTLENARLLVERYPVLDLYPLEDLAGILGTGFSFSWRSEYISELTLDLVVFANPMVVETYRELGLPPGRITLGQPKIHLALHRLFWLFNVNAYELVGQLGAMSRARQALVFDALARMGFWERVKLETGVENPQLADAYTAAFEEVFGQDDLNWESVEAHQRGRWTGEGWGKMGVENWVTKPLLENRTYEGSPEALQQVIDTTRFLHRFQELAGLIPFTSMFDKVF